MQACSILQSCISGLCLCLTKLHIAPLGICAPFEATSMLSCHPHQQRSGLRGRGAGEAGADWQSAPGRPPEASVDTRVISTPLSLFSLTPYSLAYLWKPSPALNRYLRAEQLWGSAGHRRIVELGKATSLGERKSEGADARPDASTSHKAVTSKKR